MAETKIVQQRVVTPSRMDEWVSIFLAVALAGGAAFFFWGMQGWEPTGNWGPYALAWLVLGYLAIQLVALLSSAMDTRRVGILDSVTSLLPVIVGSVVMLDAFRGTSHLSNFQTNALLLMVGTAALDFIVTLWVRFTVNRRSIGLETGS